ncbi:hypothetical protein A2U01_0033715, partial [Trifolium medium]|nr:hypothetical protein [Trifolium medium]
MSGDVSEALIDPPRSAEITQDTVPPPSAPDVDATASAWGDSFDLASFIERTLLMKGDSARFDSMATSELRKLSLSYSVKWVVLSHLLSARQEKEASEASSQTSRLKKAVEDMGCQRAEAEKKLKDEIEGLKVVQLEEIARLKREHEDILAKANSRHVSEIEELKKMFAREKDLLTLTRNACIVSLFQT